MSGPTDSGETEEPADGTAETAPEMTHLGVRVPRGLKREVNRVAYEQSDPTQRIEPSDIVREAIRDYIERFDSDPSSCNPARRGAPEVSD